MICSWIEISTRSRPSATCNSSRCVTIPHWQPRFTNRALSPLRPAGAPGSTYSSPVMPLSVGSTSTYGHQQLQVMPMRGLPGNSSASSDLCRVSDDQRDIQKTTSLATWLQHLQDCVDRLCMCVYMCGMYSTSIVVLSCLD